MPRRVAPILLLVGSLLSAVLSSAAPRAAAAAPQYEPDAIDVLLTTFYRDPRLERLDGFFDEFNRSPLSRAWSAYPPLVGFFAVVFRNHPDWIDRIVPAEPTANIVEVLAAALHLAGDEPRARALRGTAGVTDANGRLKSELSDLPARLEDLRVATATHLDILWGAAFASGDPRYVRMIADFFASTANRSEPIAIDVARSAIAMTGGPKEVFDRLRAKHGDALTREIIIAGVALWALRSNARRHGFIERAEAQFVLDQEDSPAAKAVAALRAGSTPRPAP